MTPTRFITIQFHDGKTVKYSFPVQGANKSATQLKLEDFFKGRHLVIQIEGRLVVYPIEGVRKVEFSAGSGDDLDGIRLPAHTVRDAKLVEG
jgi:hypothetical protein